MLFFIISVVSIVPGAGVAPLALACVVAASFKREASIMNEALVLAK